MVFIRFKKQGKKEYAYQVKEYWDSKIKRSRQKVKYLGVVINKEKKLFEKKMVKISAEKLVLDFGDTYLLNKFLERNYFIKLLKNIFKEYIDSLLALISYRLCYGSAMYFAQTWFEGNYIRFIYKNANISSQRISDFLKLIGEEYYLREFFNVYLTEKARNIKGVILDTTSLPNQIHIPLTAWGRSGEEIDKQIKFLLVVDKLNSEPLFFRLLPGNIVDVSALSNTIAELEKYGLKELYTCLDAGFFSEDNIKEMYEKKIDFLTRLPSSRCLYKELIKEECGNIEAYANAVRYGERGLFVKQKEVELFGNKAYTYIVLDPKRKGKEINNLVIQTIDEKEINPDLDYEFKKKGIMILVSSFCIDKKEVVSSYYTRQTAEKLFGFSKDDLNILPLRRHSEEATRGFIFLQFLSLLAFVQLKNKLGKELTVEEVLLTMRNLKCKVYENELLVMEPTKQQKLFAEKLNIILPKNLGI